MLFIAFMIACEDGEDANGEKTEIPSFTSLENDIFGLSCAFSSCHGSGTGGLTLNGIDDYERLVLAESIYVDNEILVIPGETENSYLVKKMRGTSGIMGDVMPPGGMDEEVIQRIERWIDAGALED